MLLVSLCGAQAPNGPTSSTLLVPSTPSTQSTSSTLSLAPTSPTLTLPAPATFRAFDRPSDDGSTVAVEWGLSKCDAKDIYYVVEIASKEDMESGKFRKAARIPAGDGLKSDQPKYFGFPKKNENLHYAAIEASSAYPPDRAAIQAKLEEDLRLKAGTKPEKKLQTYMDKEKARRLVREQRRLNQRPYYFRLAITDGRETRYLEENGKVKIVSASARPNLLKLFKANNLVFSIVFCTIVLLFIRAARRGAALFIRKIAGLEAVEEAIGRATEMGRPAFFVHGLTDMDSLATIAAVNILGRVARRAAEYDTRVRVMNSFPIVMAVSQEVVKQGYTEAGRPDAYNPDDVALVASDQFSYAAAVSGRMVRERPAAMFFMGSFAAEALLLAETGAATGAVQIAGTDAYTQIPFFVTTCDYTLIGEELYAASAYLSREPRMLGSLRGQDVAKAFLMILLVVGSLLLTFGVLTEVDLSWIQHILEPF
jgi:hypothetical protein